MTKPLDSAVNRNTGKVAQLKASGHFPWIDRAKWYEVIDPSDLGFFIEQVGVLRLYFWEHFEVQEAPSPPGEGGG